MSLRVPDKLAALSNPQEYNVEKHGNTYSLAFTDEPTTFPTTVSADYAQAFSLALFVSELANDCAANSETRDLCRRKLKSIIKHYV